MHHTEKILPIRHNDNLMLLRPQPEQFDLIFILSVVGVAFRVVVVSSSTGSAVRVVLSADNTIHAGVAVLCAAIHGGAGAAAGRLRRWMRQRAAEGGCAGDKGVDVCCEGFALAGFVGLLW
jgi:hypothetical protein